MLLIKYLLFFFFKSIQYFVQASQVLVRLDHLCDDGPDYDLNDQYYYCCCLRSLSLLFFSCHLVEDSPRLNDSRTYSDDSALVVVPVNILLRYGLLALRSCSTYKRTELEVRINMKSEILQD